MITLNAEKLAYKIYEYRKKYQREGDEKSDMRCAEYILRVEKELPLDNDWRGWEKLIQYHKG